MEDLKNTQVDPPKKVLSATHFPSGQLTLTVENLASLPELYAPEEKGLQAEVVVKFFCPWNHWTFYASEFDGEDIFYGFVVGDYNELGYFSLSELASVKGGLGGSQCIERDTHWKPKTLEEIMRKHGRGW